MKKANHWVRDIFLIIVGSCIYAVSVDTFTAPNNIAPGGLTGTATILNYLFNTPIGTVILVLNIPIIIWAIIEIGYKLVIKSTVAIVISSLAIDLFALFMPVYSGDPILIAVAAGVLEGVGLALVLMSGATTGGTDLAARVINNKMKFFSMGKLMMAIDGTVILVSAIVFNSFESAMYACIVVFVSTSIIDTMLYGADVGTGKMFFVMSSKAEEIGEAVMVELERGVTYLKSRGGYVKVDGEILFCAVRKFEIFQMYDIIHRIDEDAFVILGDAGSITGEGFKSVKSDDKTLQELIGKIKDKNV